MILEGKAQYSKLIQQIYFLLFTNETLGRNGSLQEVLPSIEYLIGELAYLAKQYKHNSKPHFHTNIQLSWQKLNNYYKLTNESAAYVALIALYLRYKWKYIKQRWATNIAWISTAKEQVKKAWAPYKDLTIH